MAETPIYNFHDSVNGAVRVRTHDALAQTDAEIAAEVTPVNYAYPPGNVKRYGAMGDGVTDDTAAFQSANAVGNRGIEIYVPEGTYVVTDTACAFVGSSVCKKIRGVPYRSVIWNKAGSNKPTIQAIGAQYFEIDGLVIIGAAGFPNVGIELIKDGSANRCGFFLIANVVMQTNGGGIHIQDTNTGKIENFSYHPSGLSGYGASIDTNGQPYGIKADGTGAVNSIYCYNINISGLNTIANGGNGIWLDGTSTGGPFFQDWKIDGLNCENPGRRALFLRRVTESNFFEIFTENTEIRLDNASRYNRLCIKGATTGTIVIDSTGPADCTGNKIEDSSGDSITVDALTTGLIQINNVWNSSNSDSSSGKRWIKVIEAGVLLPEILGDSGVAYGESASATAITNGSTIATSQSVVRVAPTGAVTGIILAAGAQPGQQVMVVNESGNNVTFAAAGTSNVADGTSAVIPGARQMTFIWNSATALWYH